jgi:hypothetical protein
MKLRCMLAILFFSTVLSADPVMHKFELWGKAGGLGKTSMYAGWTNGFFLARGAKAIGFANCLSEISTEQAVAMIEKYYKDHPERWSHGLGEEILLALTVNGGPCQGQNPLPELN